MNESIKDPKGDKLMAEAAYWLAICAIWPAKSISNKDAVETCKLVQSIICDGKYRFNNYIALCERILLFKAYAIEYKVVIPSPLKWFRLELESSPTSVLYKSLLRKRIKEPLYRLEWKGLAEAVLDLSEDGSDKCIGYWEKWLSERNAFEELRLFSLYSVSGHLKPRL